MKKGLLIVMIISFLITSCACDMSKNANTKKGVVDSGMLKLKVNIPYSVRQQFSNALSAEAMEKQYGKADITRKLDARSYEIRFLDDGSKLIVMYSNKLNMVIDIWQLDKLLAREEFEKLVVGKSSFNDVLSIDPYSTILQSEDTALSEHRLIGGEIATINYSNKNGVWIVNNVKFSPDPSGFTSTITSDDISLITPH